MPTHLPPATVTDAAVFGRVAVLMGGFSAEREISLKSGTAVLAALRARGVDAHALDPAKELQALPAGGFDRAFIVLHGRGGEDGSMQGYLQTLGMPYTGSGVLASALSMDKLRTKQLWQAVDLPTPPWRVIRSASDLAYAAEELGYPLAVKPVHEGSSLGMTRLEDAGQFDSAWETACRLDREVIAERWILGVEYTAGILGDRVLPLIRLETPRTFYDYEAKYFTDSTRYHCPCGLSAEREEQFDRLCARAFEIVGASGWGRVDFMVDADDHPWLLEVNTVPGMTDHSLVPMAAKTAGLAFEDLVWRILETTVPAAVESGT